MLTPVELYTYTCFDTSEVDDVLSYRMLPSEFVTGELAQAQRTPERPFSFGLSSSQSPRSIN
jgi:hypothetical protein